MGNSHTCLHGAGDEVRTRDIQLGRLMLYQLSYTRSYTLRPNQQRSPQGADGGGRRIRTFVAKSRQSYSLLPLTTRASLHNHQPSFKLRKWSWRWDSNPQPADYKSAALPIELCQHKANAEFNLYFEFCQSFEGIERNFTSGFRLPGEWDRLRPSGREEELEPHDRC